MINIVISLLHSYSPQRKNPLGFSGIEWKIESPVTAQHPSNNCPWFLLCHTGLLILKAWAAKKRNSSGVDLKCVPSNMLCDLVYIDIFTCKLRFLCFLRKQVEIFSCLFVRVCTLPYKRLQNISFCGAKPQLDFCSGTRCFSFWA